MFITSLVNNVGKSFRHSQTNKMCFLTVAIRVMPRKVFSTSSTITGRKCVDLRRFVARIICRVPRDSSRCLIRFVSFRPNNSVYFMQWRTIHLSNNRKALPPVFWIILRPIAKLAAIIFGRTLRKWWQSLPPERKTIVKEKIERNIVPIIGFVGMCIGGFFHYYLSHLEQDPNTKRWRFIAFTHEQMLQIAQMELETQVEEFHGMILKPSHGDYSRVVNVANRILQANMDLAGVKDKDWAVTVVDHPTQKNAFVLPNGNIFIFTGMLQICDNDDQLGVVLAHEMSHAILGHMVEQLSNVQLVEWLLLIPLVVMWALLPDGVALFSQWLSGRFASIMFHLPFSRAIETEADRIGLELAAKACFDIREASVFWAKMAIMSQDETPFEWLSTHPSHETREQILNSMMPSAIRRRTECMCPPLPHPDPRVFVASLRDDLKNRRIELVKRIS